MQLEPFSFPGVLSVLFCYDTALPVYLFLFVFDDYAELVWRLREWQRFVQRTSQVHCQSAIIIE